MAISNNHPRNIGFFGTRNMPVPHQQLIEVLAYAIVLTVSCLANAVWVNTNMQCIFLIFDKYKKYLFQ